MCNCGYQSPVLLQTVLLVGACCVRTHTEAHQEGNGPLVTTFNLVGCWFAVVGDRCLLPVHWGVVYACGCNNVDASTPKLDTCEILVYCGELSFCMAYGDTLQAPGPGHRCGIQPGYKLGCGSACPPVCCSTRHKQLRHRAVWRCQTRPLSPPPPAPHSPKSWCGLCRGLVGLIDAPKTRSHHHVGHCSRTTGPVIGDQKTVTLTKKTDPREDGPR